MFGRTKGDDFARFAEHLRAAAVISRRVLIAIAVGWDCRVLTSGAVSRRDNAAIGPNSASPRFTAEFRSINPECKVPVLEADDGRRIAEVIAICLYFELARPEPALMGVGVQDRAIIADWHHRIERQGFWAVGDAFRNSAPGLKGRALPCPDDYEQISALAERGLARTARFFEMLDRTWRGARSSPATATRSPTSWRS